MKKFPSLSDGTAKNRGERGFRSPRGRSCHDKIVITLRSVTVDADVNPPFGKYFSPRIVLKPVPVSCLRIVALYFQHHREVGELFVGIVVFHDDQGPERHSCLAGDRAVCSGINVGGEKSSMRLCSASKFSFAGPELPRRVRGVLCQVHEEFRRIESCRPDIASRRLAFILYVCSERKSEKESRDESIQKRFFHMNPFRDKPKE